MQVLDRMGQHTIGLRMAHYFSCNSCTTYCHCFCTEPHIVWCVGFARGIDVGAHPESAFSASRIRWKGIVFCSEPNVRDPLPRAPQQLWCARKVELPLAPLIRVANGVERSPDVWIAALLSLGKGEESSETLPVCSTRRTVGGQFHRGITSFLC